VGRSTTTNSYKGFVAVVRYTAAGANQKPHRVWCRRDVDLEALKLRLEISLNTSLAYFNVVEETERLPIQPEAPAPEMPAPELLPIVVPPAWAIVGTLNVTQQPMVANIRRDVFDNPFDAMCRKAWPWFYEPEPEPAAEEEDAGDVLEREMSDPMMFGRDCEVAYGFQY
jgi:hypothetical protein